MIRRSTVLGIIVSVMLTNRARAESLYEVGTDTKEMLLADRDTIRWPDKNPTMMLYRFPSSPYAINGEVVTEVDQRVEADCSGRLRLIHSDFKDSGGRVVGSADHDASWQVFDVKSEKESIYLLMCRGDAGDMGHIKGDLPSAYQTYLRLLHGGKVPAPIFEDHP